MEENRNAIAYRIGRLNCLESKKRDQRQNEWAKRIEAYKDSGLTMVAWCSANQVNLEQLKDGESQRRQPVY